MRSVEQLPSGNAAKFHAEFVDQDIPCVIKGIAADWPAIREWSFERLSAWHGDVLLPISNYPGQGNVRMSEKKRMPLAAYLDFVRKAAAGDPSGRSPLYAAGWHYLKDCPALARDLGRPVEFEGNWIDRLQGIINFDQTSLFIGHPAAETPLHTDSFFASTWLVMISGTKRVRLIPGTCTGYVKNGLDVFDEEVQLELRRREIPVFDAEISTSDALFIPPGWWHQVRNRGATIAVSNNYVSRGQFLAFEQQVRAKLLKPILGLSRLRQEAAAGGPALGPETRASSRYAENERSYVDFLKAEVRAIDKILQEMESAC